MQHYILNTDPSLFNLILIQEPWLDSFGNARGNHHWCIVYPPTRYTDGYKTIRAIILVNTNLSTDAYSALQIHHSGIAAICLKGDFGHCSVFNIYNDCNDNLAIEALRTYLRENLATALPLPTDHMLWLGDFNRHHPLWEDNKNHRLYNPPHLINPLIDTLQEYNMQMALPSGIPTLKTVLGNWTRPDNVWRSNNPLNPIISCNTKPSICPPRADHLPIVTSLDLSISQATSFPSRNMQKANFADLNEKLCTHLEMRSPATCINHREDIDGTAESVISIIKETIEEEIPLSKPSPYAKHWWTKELTELKKEKNRISNLSYKQHGLPDAPIHAMHKEATRKLCCRIDEVKKEHWSNWLEEALPRDIYIANNYITNAPSDYANARIPSLKHSNPTGTNTTTNTNPRKVAELATALCQPTLSPSKLTATSLVRIS